MSLTYRPKEVPVSLIHWKEKKILKSRLKSNLQKYIRAVQNKEIFYNRQEQL